jgi:protein-tyrosine-phosphatase
LDLTHFQSVYKLAAASLHPALAEQEPNPAVQLSATSRPPARILFLCTHNSARSQIAEALLRHLGGDAVEVYSAGTQPSRVHPGAVVVLQEQGVDTSFLSSKHLEHFIGQSFDFVITVCDNAREACPIFPGHPERIHWSFPDPSAASDPDEQRQAFAHTFVEMEKRLKILLILIQRERGGL